MAELRAFAITMMSIPTFYLGIVLFGASIFDKFAETLFLAASMAVLIVAPIAFTTNGHHTIMEELIFDLTPSTKSQYHSLRCSAGALFGTWLGAFVIPLDWDRWWQEWPLPCIFGAIGGFTIGLLESYVELQIISTTKRREKKSDKTL